MSDDNLPIPEPGEICLGPPCRHFPDWVKTPQEAQDWLHYKMLSGAEYAMNDLERRIKARGTKA